MRSARRAGYHCTSTRLDVSFIVERNSNGICEENFILHSSCEIVMMMKIARVHSPKNLFQHISTESAVGTRTEIA